MSQAEAAWAMLAGGRESVDWASCRVLSMVRRVRECVSERYEGLVCEMFEVWLGVQLHMPVASG